MICQICENKSYISFFQTYTNFDNQAERKVDRNVPRKKPLMYFCFDLLEDQSSTPDQFQTVAVNIVEFHLTASVNRLHQCLSGYISCECSGPDMNGLHWAAVGGTSRGRRVMAQGPLFLHSPVSFSF